MIVFFISLISIFLLNSLLEGKHQKVNPEESADLQG